MYQKARQNSFSDSKTCGKNQSLIVRTTKQENLEHTVSLKQGYAEKSTFL